MDFAQAVKVLSGKKSVEQNLNSGPVTTQVISGRVVSKSTDGQVKIEMDGSVYSADDSQYITVDTVGGLEEGDEVTLLLSGHYGYGMAPFALGSPGSVDRIVTNVEVVKEKVTEIYADYVKASLLQADVAELGFLTANSATITDLASDTAKIHSLTAEELSATIAYISTLEADNITAATIIADNAKLGQLDVTSINADIAKIHSLTAEELEVSVAYISDLTTGNVTAANIIADKAKLAQLDAESINADVAKIHSLTAEEISAATGYIEDLTAGSVTASDIIADKAKLGQLDVSTINADHAVINTLDANYAHITNGVIDNAKISYADVNNLSANYAQINLANVNNAWIENGVVKDAAISDAKIIGVSANKITAGTIDASKINVTNLRADSLIVNKINGQPVIGGYVAVDSNASGYSSMNPSTQGWYEIQNGSMVASSDTTVNPAKAYYTTGTSVALYDQAYIDTQLSDLQSQVDGNIETWTLSAVPTLSNHPAQSWSTTSEKDRHVGDVAYVNNPSSEADGYSYRFSRDENNNYSWELIRNTEITKLLQDMIDVQGDISALQTYDQDVASWRTSTNGVLSNVQNSISSLSTSLGQKVDTTTFNTVSQAVDVNTSSISNLTTATDGLSERMTQAETDIQQTADALELTATKTEVHNSLALNYRHTYELSNGTYTFTAKAYKGSEDVTDRFRPDMFVWYLRTEEDGDTFYANGPVMTIDASNAGLRGSVIGGLEETISGHLVDESGNHMVDENGNRIAVFAVWEV